MIKPTKEFWDVFKNTNGALSCTEAVAIMNLAEQAPIGNYCEMGVYKGKSCISALCGLKKDANFFFLIEPEFNDDKWCVDIEFLFESVKSIVGSEIEPILISDYSTNCLPLTNTKYAWVFSDAGSHQDGLPLAEVKLLEDRMVQGGIIAFHDWNSQFREVKEASDYLVGTGKYEYIPINWDEIIEYVNSENLEEGNQSWHHNELRNPCFVGAVRRK